MRLIFHEKEFTFLRIPTLRKGRVSWTTLGLGYVVENFFLFPSTKRALGSTQLKNPKTLKQFERKNGISCIFNNSNAKIAATRNIKAIRPLLDRVLVSRIKAETVHSFLVYIANSRKLQAESLFQKNHRKSYPRELSLLLALVGSTKTASEFPWTLNQATRYAIEFCGVNH